jgi:hypothetical protein
LPAAAASSPLALQSQAWAAAEDLRHTRNRLAHGLAPESEGQLKLAVEPAELPLIDRLRRDLMNLGDEVDSVETDTKWTAFVAELSRRQTSHAVVFCDFAETAVYVADRLHAIGIDANAVVEGSSLPSASLPESRVVVVSDEMLQGLDLRWARAAYNYDLPPSQRRAQIRWSRLDWWHQEPPAEMVTLLDKRNATPTERMAFTQLRYMVGGDD